MARTRLSPEPNPTILTFLSPVHAALEVASLARALTLPEFDLRLTDGAAAATPLMAVFALAAIAVGAIAVAIVAHRNDARRRNAVRKLVANDPAARVLGEGWRDVADDQGARGVAPHAAYSPVRLPRWLQLASLVVALGVTWYVAQRILPNNAKRPPEETALAMADSGTVADPGARVETASAEGLDSVPFAFRAREWTDIGDGCAGELVVTRGTAAPWALTMAVHDESGRRLDTAHARVDALRPGEVVEFRFSRAACDRISAWEVRGQSRTP